MRKLTIATSMKATLCARRTIASVRSWLRRAMLASLTIAAAAARAPAQHVAVLSLPGLTGESEERVRLAAILEDTGERPSLLRSTSRETPRTKTWSVGIVGPTLRGVRN